MLQLIEANWLAFIVALLIGIVIAWWIFARGSKPARERDRGPDVLDEGAAPARRNQALIDAPPAAATAQPFVSAVTTNATTTAAAFAGTGPDIMGGIGEIVGAAAAEEAAAEAAKEEALLHRDPPVHVPPPSAFAGEPDDLRRIKGIGPKLAAQLTALGVTHYHQIAGWTDDDLDRIDGQLGAFAGRPRRDNWVEQARLLAGGDTAGYEEKFGRL